MHERGGSFAGAMTASRRAAPTLGSSRAAKAPGGGTMDATLAIRPARPDEREALEELQRRASLANPGDREALLAHPDAIEVPREQIERGQVLVAAVGGELRGFGAILPREDGDAELDALFVDPTHWQQGLGRALVEALAAQARQEGAAALHVIGNPHAEGFYRATGFELTGTHATRFGVGLRMRRPL